MNGRHIPKSDISPARLRELLSYDPVTGIFTWKFRKDGPNKWNNKWAGKQAGTISKRGYVIINISRTLYAGHRLAWTMMMDEWPVDQIDHRNNVKTDNRWENLRHATFNQNAQNRSITSANSSGYKGVRWNKFSKKWQGEIKKDGKKYYLGLFESPEEAHKEYVKKARELFGEFARE